MNYSIHYNIVTYNNLRYICQSYLVLELFVALHQKYWIPYLLTFCSLNPYQSQPLRLRLKNHYFQSAYPAPSANPQWALILFWDFGAIYHLLTYLHVRYGNYKATVNYWLHKHNNTHTKQNETKNIDKLFFGHVCLSSFKISSATHGHRYCSL